MKTIVKQALTGVVLSSACLNANAVFVNSDSQVNVGSDWIGASANYHTTDTISGSFPNQTYTVNSAGGAKGSFLKDTKSIASYTAALAVSKSGAKLTGSMNLGTSRVWYYNNTLKVGDFVNPFGNYVVPINFNGGQKWAYGALSADLSVKGSAAYNGNASLTMSNGAVSAIFHPNIEVGGQLNAKVSTKWTTTAVLAALDFGSALIKLIAVKDDGVRVSAATSDAGEVGMSTRAMIDIPGRFVNATVYGNVRYPKAKGSVQGYIVYRKPGWDGWFPTWDEVTKTFGTKTIFNVDGGSKDSVLLNKSFNI